MVTALRHAWGKNGKVITLSVYPKEMILYFDQYYDFTFNIKTENNYFGSNKFLAICTFEEES